MVMARSDTTLVKPDVNSNLAKAILHLVKPLRYGRILEGDPLTVQLNRLIVWAFQSLMINTTLCDK